MDRTYIVCAAGIYSCFLLWQIFQEYIVVMEIDGRRFKHFVFLNLVQSISAAIAGLIYTKICKQKLRLQSWKIIRSIMLCSILGSISPQLGYRAARYVDYPTIIIGKSCKLVPVLLTKVVFFKAKVARSKFAVVMLVTLGLYIFMREKAPTQISGQSYSGFGVNDLIGVSLIGGGLALDGIINSIQDQVFFNSTITGPQMMFLSGLLGSTLVTSYFLLLKPTELQDALIFLSQNKGWLPYLCCFILSGVIGQCFVYYTLQELGSLSLVTLTMTRKMASILLNILLFKHKLTRLQWLAVGIVLSGIAIDSRTKKLSTYRRKLKQ